MKRYTRYAEVPLEDFNDEEENDRRDLTIWIAGELVKYIYDKMPADYKRRNIAIRMTVIAKEGSEDKNLSELLREEAGNE